MELCQAACNRAKGRHWELNLALNLEFDNSVSQADNNLVFKH